MRLGAKARHGKTLALASYHCKSFTLKAGLCPCSAIVSLENLLDRTDTYHMETLNKHFRALTEPVFKKHGFAQVELLARWPEIAGPALAAVSTPEKIRWPRGNDEKTGGTLHLKVQAGRGLDVQYATHSIIEKVNRFLGYQGVSALKIMQTHEAIKTTKIKALAPTPTASVLAQVSPVDDPDLKSALARLGAGVTAAQQRSPQAK